MKHNYLLLSSFLFVSLGLIFTSNSSGPASNNNRATGAPGDGTQCTSCHVGGSFGTVSIDFGLTDGGGGAITEYEPGATYVVNVNVSNSSGSPAGYGFQAIALEDAGDTPLNSFANPGSGVQLSTSASRQYAEHTGPSASGSFTFDWTAPAAGTGDVTFYLGANAVNGNGSNAGDNAALSNFTFSEMGDTTDTNGGDPNGIFDLASHQMNISVYPNPAVDVIQLSGVELNSRVDIFSIKGELIMSATARRSQMDVSTLQSGIYLIRSEKGSGKFIKH